MNHEQSGYARILRSTSIVGGAQGLTYMVGLIRVKIIAVLLGPSGVGLVGLYLSATSLFQTIAGMGLQTSGVREIAIAQSASDPKRLASATLTLRRVSLVAGLLGWALMAAFSRPASVYLFGSDSYRTELILLGACIFLSVVSNGQVALVQGMRRIGDLARINVWSVMITTALSIGLYWWMGEQGIVPALIVSAAATLAVSWWFSSRVILVKISQTLRQTVANSREMLGLGVAFMWSAVLAALAAMIIRGFVQREYGLEGSGYYQAAWSLSGMLANFVLTAMVADFGPRLASVKDSNELLTKAINEQTEVALLLGAPGIFAAISFAPIILDVFYTREFANSAPLLVWFSVGVFARLISWPLGALTGTLNMQRMIYFTQTLDAGLVLLLTLVLVPSLGLVGAGVAFAVTNWFGLAIVLVIARRRIRFSYSGEAFVLIAVALLTLTLLVMVSISDQRALSYVVGGLVCVVSGVLALRELIKRLGPQSRVALLTSRLPILSFLARK